MMAPVHYFVTIFYILYAKIFILAFLESEIIGHTKCRRLVRNSKILVKECFRLKVPVTLLRNSESGTTNMFRDILVVYETFKNAENRIRLF
jgi:hypothetical protein